MNEMLKMAEGNITKLNHAIVLAEKYYDAMNISKEITDIDIKNILNNYSKWKRVEEHLHLASEVWQDYDKDSYTEIIEEEKRYIGAFNNYHVIDRMIKSYGTKSRLSLATVGAAWLQGDQA